MMPNADRAVWRVVAFDIAAPSALIAGLVMIGAVLEWPVWWVSACSVLTVLVVEGMVANYLMLRRESVTVGTDDERPGLRLVVAGLCAAALATAAGLGYTRWTVPDRNMDSDTDQVVATAVEMAQTAATVTPMDPESSIDRAAAMMVPDRVEAFKQNIGRTAGMLASRNIAVDAEPLSAGVEAIGPAAARVAVVLRSVHTTDGHLVKQAVVPVRITLTKRDGDWLVLDMSPIHAR